MFGLLMIVASPHATFSIACVMAFVLLAVLISSIRTRRLQIFAGVIFALVVALQISLDAAGKKNPSPDLVLTLCTSEADYQAAYGWFWEIKWWLDGC